MLHIQIIIKIIRTYTYLASTYIHGLHLPSFCHDDLISIYISLSVSIYIGLSNSWRDVFDFRFLEINIWGKLVPSFSRLQPFMTEYLSRVANFGYIFMIFMRLFNTSFDLSNRVLQVSIR